MLSRVVRTSACAAMAFGLAAGPASALTIIPEFGPSITKLANAKQVETAFDAVASLFDYELSSPITVNIGVSWGSVDGFALPPSAVGASESVIYGYYTYPQMVSYLRASAMANPSDTVLASAVANLPETAPSGAASGYAIPSAEMKALGLLPRTQTLPDGFIGFTGTPANFTFATTAELLSGTYTVAPGTYDFAAVAAHEIEEVLGRISGIESNAAPTYRTTFDLFRYDAKGVLDDSYTPPVGETPYFSVNGGVTDLANFNDSRAGGDRSDWSNSGATATDLQNAFISTGVRRDLSAVDIIALDALGYGGANIGDRDLGKPTAIAFDLDSAPEPDAWAMILAGSGMIGGVARRARRARALTAASRAV